MEETPKFSSKTYSYEMDGDKHAFSWMRVYYMGEIPNEIIYTLHYEPSYTLLMNSLASNGFKQINKKQEGNKTTSTYKSPKFSLVVITEKKKEPQNLHKTYMTYTMRLVKSDPKNGRKYTYWKGSNKVKAIYTLEDGKLIGRSSVFYKSGAKHKIGYFVDGRMNGEFRTYSERFSLEQITTMKDGEKNGLTTIYKDYVKKHVQNGNTSTTTQQKISEEKEYVKGVLSGQYKHYFYNKDGQLIITRTGNYLDGKRDGKWSGIAVQKDGKIREVVETNYANGLKEGKFHNIQGGDSLLVGEYSADKLEGALSIYFDKYQSEHGGLIRTDTANMILICHGNYSQGQKTGEWQYYNTAGALLKNVTYSAESKSAEKSDSKAETKSDSKADSKTDKKSDSKADAKPDTKPDSKSEEKANEKTEEKLDQKATTKTTTKTTTNIGKKLGKNSGQALKF